jgi:tRNA-specific 2-thiouridylase
METLEINQDLTQVGTKNATVVAMSGGVDSSVAAAMMSQEHNNVIGITLKLYDEKKVTKSKTCCAGSDIIDAKRIASTINIPHYVLDYEAIFKANVIDPFIAEYKAGRTPIPCINCNEKVKFLDLIEFARKIGASSLVTGHYIRKMKTGNEWGLYIPADEDRDQSYFLFSLKYEDLDYLDFPLGDFKKDEIRNFAKNLELHLYDKVDSQDICFIPDGKYKDFIQKKSQSSSKGNIVDMNNNILAEHDGIYNFTVGQRRGIGVSKKTPVYVKEIDATNNRVIVAEKEYVKSSSIIVERVNLLTKQNINDAYVRVRSSGKLLKAKISKVDNFYEVQLDVPEIAVSPGQACVFYKSDSNGIRLLGGGWIKSAN